MSFRINPYNGEIDLSGVPGAGLPASDVDVPDSLAISLGLPANANLEDVLFEIEQRVRFHEHVQVIAATTWNITHNLGVNYPSITVIDNTGELVIAYDINPVSVNALDLVFDYNIAGRAELYR